MAKGQLTYLQLTNRVLQRLGKSQTDSSSFAGLAADSWGGLVKDALNDGQAHLYSLHDWSTLYTSGTFTTSSRTYDLSSSFTGFGREIDLVSTTNNRVLTPVNARDLDEADPGLDDSGAPTAYSIQYPNLLFDRTPSSEAFRLRYVTRPTTLSTHSQTGDLPEQCDRVLVLWAVWDLLRTRDDVEGRSLDGHERALESALRDAIRADGKRMDRVWQMQSAFPTAPRFGPVWPPSYERE